MKKHTQRQRAAMVDWQSTGTNRADLLRRQRLLHFLIQETLTPRQRDCLLAYYRDGCPQPQIAHTLGISVSTVSRHIKAGRDALRQGIQLSELLSRPAP